MIPGLLSGRLLGAAGGSGVVASPVYQTSLAFAVGQYSAETTSFFTINPDGTWTWSGNNYAGGSGLWYNPATAGAGSTREVRITLTKTPYSESGVTVVDGIISNPASGWVSLASARQVSVKVQRFTQGVSYAEYSALVQIRPTGGAVVSSGTFSFKTRVQVDSTGNTGPDPTCVDIGMWLQPGLRAGEVQVGQVIDGAVYGPIGVVPREVMANPIAQAPCWRITTPSGAAVVASESTPMTLRDGSTAYMPDMLGREVLVDDDAGTRWETVESCLYVGERHVVKINVSDTCYFAGEHPMKRIATHNAQLKP